VSLNYGHYNNPTVDQLFAEASATTDTETRVRLYKKAGKLISEDFASIFLFQTKNQSYIHSKRVSRMKDTFQYRIGTQTWWMTDPQ
jgi:ABC-type transport system substrate-binding protein